MTRPWVLGLVLAFFQATAALPQDAPFILGTQTHFTQGWSLDILTPAHALGVRALRDEIVWNEVETEKGVYDFSKADLYMRPLIDRGFVPLIVINEVNALYDGQQTPHTDQGRAGFAAYVSAILSHYGAEAVKIEIGNEVNTQDFANGPALEDPPGHFAALVRAVDARLSEDHPEAQFSCSGLNTIGMDFFRAFFRRGGLVACDAISIHPYRDFPETLPGELDRLRELMAEFGGEKPIYVTEFGNWFEDAQDAPDYMLKMVSLLAAADVKEAYWYALSDEQWWPNMGLLDISGVKRKPAAATFSFLQEKLIPLGRPTRRGDDRAAHIYHFGQSGAVFWGSGGKVQVTGAASFFDAKGQQIDPVDTLSDSPVIVLGDGISITHIAPGKIADSLYQYGHAPWTYFARRPDIGLVPLEIVDSNWTSTRGAPDLFPLKIKDEWIASARFNGQPYTAIERFTATESGVHQIEGWWEAAEETFAPYLRILHNGGKIFEADLLTNRAEVTALNVTLESGDTLDFEIAPREPNGDGAARRRIRIIGP